LLFAIMREESAFNPKAISPRQARGLMQMIDSTAWRLAKRANIGNFRLHNLFKPQTSVRLGALYVGSLLEMFDGNLVAAVAAYHAGEAAVRRWLKDRPDLPPDEFVEEIPYDSTRSYVKKVLSSYGVYRIVYG